MKFHYDKEIAEDVRKRLKQNEDAMETIEKIMNRLDDISSDNQMAGLFDNINFFELRNQIKLFKENNITALHEQIKSNNDAVEGSDISMADKVGK